MTADVELDDEGLPLSYDRAKIQAYWDARPGEMQSRWVEFLAVGVPFLTKARKGGRKAAGPRLSRGGGPGLCITRLASLFS